MGQNRNRDRVSPSPSILDIFLGRAPKLDSPTPEEQAEMDKIALSEQSKDPTWKQNLRKTFEGVTAGLIGEEPNPTRRGIEDWTNFGTQGAMEIAGLPFAAYKAMGKLPKGFLTHGTQRVWDKIDPERFDTSDVLGHMFHAAENPEYSNKYAMGTLKGLTPVDPSPTAKIPKKAHDFRSGGYVDVAPRTVPIEPQAQNVLDLVDPNPDDMSQALAALTPYERKHLISNYKEARRRTREAKDFIGTVPANERSKWEGPSELAQELGINPAHIRHRGTDLTFDELPVRALAEHIRISPEQFQRIPFDAIRYNDMAEKSWAIPAETTPIKTAFGFPLNEPPKPVTMFRTNEPGPARSQLVEGPSRLTKFRKPGAAPTTEDELYKAFIADEIDYDQWKKGVSDLEAAKSVSKKLAPEEYKKYSDQLEHIYATTDMPESHYITAKKTLDEGEVPYTLDAGLYNPKSKIDTTNFDNIAKSDPGFFADTPTKEPRFKISTNLEDVEIPTLFGVPATPVQIGILHKSGVLSDGEFAAIMKKLGNKQTGK